MCDPKGNSTRFGKCEYCQKSSENVCCACKAWYCNDSCIKTDWKRHKHYCQPRTVHIDKFEVSIQNVNENIKTLEGSLVEAQHEQTIKETPIPTDKFTKVVISWIDQLFYWVFKLDDVEAQSKIQDKINVYCTSDDAKKISPDDAKCCAPFGGEWYRANILSKRRDTALVKFIDYGNDSFIKLNDALQLPDDLLHFEPLAFQVRFAAEKPIEIPVNTTLDVKALKMDGVVCVVQIQGCPMKSETSPMKSLPPAVSVEGSINSHKKNETNGSSAIETVPIKSFNAEQRQNESSSNLFQLKSNKPSLEVHQNIKDYKYTVNQDEYKNDTKTKDKNDVDKAQVSTKEQTIKETPIPTDKFTKIVVSWVDEPVYWVFKFDDAKTQSVIEEKLIMHCSSPLSQIKISPDDTKCCAPFEGGWYRAEILSKDNHTAVVRFIDFGNDCSIKLKDALKLPKDLLSFKPLAFQVRSAHGKFQINEIFDVKAIRQDGDICEVQIQGCEMKDETLSVKKSSPPPASVETSFNIPINGQANGTSAVDTESIKSVNTEQHQSSGDINLPCTINERDRCRNLDQNNQNNKYNIEEDKITDKHDSDKDQVSRKANTPPIPTDKFTTIVISWADEQRYWAFKLDDVEDQSVIEQKLNEYCTSSCANKISPDDTKCCASFEGGWYRAEILSKDNDMAVVRFIDFGNDGSIELKDALKLPEELLSFKPLAFQVRSAHGKFQMNEAFDVKAIKQDGDICEVQIQGYEMKDETLSVKNSSPLPASVETSVNIPKKGEANGISAVDTESIKSVNTEQRQNESHTPSLHETKNKLNIHQNIKDDKYKVNNDQYQNDIMKIKDKNDVNKAQVSTKEQTFKETPIPTDKFIKVETSFNMPKKVEANGTSVIDTKSMNSFNAEQRQNSGDINLPCTINERNRCRNLDQTNENNKYNIGEDKITDKNDSDKAQVSRKENTAPIPTDKFCKLSGNITNVDTFKQFTPRIPNFLYSSTRRNNHIITHLQPSSTRILVQAQRFIGENCLTGFILIDDIVEGIPAYKSIKFIANLLSTAKSDLEFKPSLKDEVSARVGGIWYRGYVTMINPDEINVALLDLGVIVVPEALAPLPQQVKSIAETGVRCIFSTPHKNLTNLVGEQFVLKNVQYQAGKLFGDTEKFGQVTILPWEPTYEDAGLTSIKIKSGMQCTLIAFHSPNEIYLQSIDQNCALKNLVRDVATYSLKSPSQIRKPWYGQIVSCLSSKDNKHNRAQVLQKLGDRYEVKFIDFGFVETVALSNIKPLDDKLKSVPCFATKVGLAGFPGSVFNEKAINFMNQLMDNNSLITVEVENNNPTKVRLFQGENDINKFLYQAMLPSWSSQNETDRVSFMSNDIMHEKWLTGQNMRLTTLAVKAFNEIVVVNQESAVVKQVANMTSNINDYCSRDATPYNPRIQEMCLAKYQDETGSNNWYRAMCSISYENASTVYFIDFGNYSEVSHINIRKMPPEFMNYPAASKICKVYGLSDSLQDETKEDIANGYMDNQANAMVVCDHYDGSAVVYIPKLMDFLVQLNLLSISPPPPSYL